MKSISCRAKNEEGFILVTALVVLVLLTFLGTFASNTTMFELQISGNDKVARDTFFKADGGVQAGVELIEENVSCPTGFVKTTTAIGGIDIMESAFAYNLLIEDIEGADNTSVLDVLPSDTIRSIRIPDDPASRVDTAPHTNIAIWGATDLLDGSDLTMVAAYAGLAKNAPGGGTCIDYNLHSQHVGVANSVAEVAILWRHMIGREGTCNY